MDKKAFFAALFSTFIWAATFSLRKMMLQYQDGEYKLGVFPYPAIRFVCGLGYFLLGKEVTVLKIAGAVLSNFGVYIAEKR